MESLLTYDIAYLIELTKDAKTYHIIFPKTSEISSVCMRIHAKLNSFCWLTFFRNALILDGINT